MVTPDVNRPSQTRMANVLTVPSDSLDFVRYNSHMELIAAKIMEKLHGKEVVVFD